jgi:hypothetical protein
MSSCDRISHTQQRQIRDISLGYSFQLQLALELVQFFGNGQQQIHGLQYMAGFLYLAMTNKYWT